MNYAAGIAKARRLAGLSQGALARKIFSNASTISRLEGGSRHPSVTMLGWIADACGCTVAALVRWSQVADKALAKKPRREPRS